MEKSRVHFRLVVDLRLHSFQPPPQLPKVLVELLHQAQAPLLGCSKKEKREKNMERGVRCVCVCGMCGMCACACVCFFVSTSKIVSYVPTSARYLLMSVAGEGRGFPWPCTRNIWHMYHDFHFVFWESARKKKEQKTTPCVWICTIPFIKTKRDKSLHTSSHSEKRTEQKTVCTY